MPLSFNQYWMILSCLSLAPLLASTALSLPEDASQPIETESLSTELLLAEGIVIYRGIDQRPAKMSQGSLIITGTEIRIVRKDGLLQTVSAIGNPASFQQQPQANQPIVLATGNSISMDNNTRMLNVDGSASFRQADLTLDSAHIDYNLDTRRANATSATDNDRVRMSVNKQTSATP